MANNNVIILNGKQYDTISGKLLDFSSSIATSALRPAKKHKLKSGRQGMAVDGFMRSAQAAPTALAPTIKPQVITPNLYLSKKTGKSHPIAKLNAHQPEHAKTLMRHIVKRPVVTKKMPIKTQSPTDIMRKLPSVVVAPKTSFLQFDARRKQHSMQVAKSGVISHFSSKQARQTQVNHVAPVPTPAKLAPRADIKPTQNHVPTRAQKASDDIFKAALAHANSHQQKPLKRTKKQSFRAHRRLAGITASVLAILLIGGFVTYLNRTSINLEMASAKAGFHASVPGYKPNGYAIKSFKSAPGAVTIGMRAPNNQSINVVQKTSNWDSQTLLENFVATNNANYQAYQDGGRTIYVYGNDQATWVNGGIWYQIQSSNKLSTNQLINIATSM